MQDEESNEKITLKLDSSNVKKFKTLADKLVETHKLKISALRYGKIGHNIIVSFNVSSSQYSLTLEKLLLNNFNALFLDEETQKAIKKTSSGPLLKEGESIWGNSKKQNEFQNTNFDDVISKGNYKELIKIATDFRSSPEQKEKAKNGINSAVDYAIQAALKKAEKGKRATSEAISDLIVIASDKNLRTMQKNDLLKSSGLAALELAVSSPDYYEDLLELCSNTQLHYLVTIRAFVMFSKLVLPNKESFESLLGMALRRINLRWVTIAYDVVVNELSFEEKNLITDLTDFVESNK